MEKQEFTGEKNRSKYIAQTSGSLVCQKKNQLLNTLVHELRHRSNPGLGHNSEFYKLVKKDVACVNNYLIEL